MLLPLGTDRSTHRPVLVTPALIVVNLVVFVVQQIVVRQSPELPDRIDELFRLVPGRSAGWTYLTYAFLHAGFLHVAGNMVFLWVFGRDVEDRLGRLWFLLFYLAGAAAAGAGHAWFYPNPVVGASGAVAAVTGAFLVLFPRTHVRIFCFFIVIGVISIPSWCFIASRIAWDMLMEGAGRGGNVARLAHLAGYGFGFVVAFLLLATGVLKREPVDLLAVFKQAARRREFREMDFQRRRAERASRHAAAADAAASEALAGERAGVARALAAGELDAAAGQYRRLLAGHGAEGNAAVLSRRHQYDLANHLFRSGDHQTSIVAYELFLRAYPRDPEAPAIKALIGRIAARYLNDPVRARQALNEAIAELRDEHTLALAKQELADLG